MLKAENVAGDAPPPPGAAAHARKAALRRFIAFMAFCASEWHEKLSINEPEAS